MKCRMQNVLAKAVNSIQEAELTKCSLTIYQVPIRNKCFQQEKQRLIEPKRCKSKGLSNPITGHLPLLCNGRVNNPSKAFARRQRSLHGSTRTCCQRDQPAPRGKALSFVVVPFLSFYVLVCLFSSVFVYHCLSLLVRVLVCPFLSLCVFVCLGMSCLPSFGSGTSQTSSFCLCLNNEYGKQYGSKRW